MKIIFVTGHRKSGTSVFHKLFEGHTEANSFPVDISVFYAYFPCFVASGPEQENLLCRLRVVLEKVTAPMEGRVPAGGGRAFAFSAFWDHFRAGLRPGDTGRRSKVLRRVLEAFAETIAADPEKTWVVKETSQAIFARELLTDFSDMKMLNLLRDPRDNYAALKTGVGTYYARLGEDEKKTLASLINRARVDFLCSNAMSAEFSDRFLSVRFEDVAQETDATMRKVADFCGLAFDPVLLSPTFLGGGYAGNSHEGTVFSGVSAENIGRWRERISDDEAMIIEFWMRGVMEEFDYPPAYPPGDAAAAFAGFYEWYNCTYFFKDSFA